MCVYECIYSFQFTYICICVYVRMCMYMYMYVFVWTKLRDLLQGFGLTQLWGHFQPVFVRCFIAFDVGT